MWPNPQETAGLVTFTEDILHRKLYFLCSVCAINDANKFSKVCKYIYPKQFELNIEHQDTHASFLKLDISIDDGFI